MRHITIPEGTSSIGANAFEECSMLRFLTVPASVTEIDPDAFVRNEALTLRVVKDSAAEAFAIEQGIPFCTIDPAVLTGDLDGDGKVDSADAQLALKAATESLAGNDFTWDDATNR